MTDEEMTKEFLEIMKSCSGDTESQHVNGDEFIAEMLSGLGYEKLSEAFLDAQSDWWYA